MKRTLNAVPSFAKPSAFMPIAPRISLNPITHAAPVRNLRITTTPRQEALLVMHWTGDSAVLSEDSISDEENMAASEPEVRVMPSSQPRYAADKPSWWNEEYQQTLVEENRFNMPFHSTLSYREVFAWIATSPAGIETLDLKEQHLSYQDLKVLADALKKNAILGSVILDETDIDNERAKVIVEILSENKHLRSISIDNIYVSSAALTAIFNALTTNTSLTYLSLCDNSFNTKTEKALVRLLRVNKHLKELNIGGCRITFDGLRKIFLALMSGTVLASLDISSNKFNAKCEAALVKMIKTNKSIEVLEIENCKISDIGIKAIFGAVKFNTKIRRVWMSQLKNSENFYVLEGEMEAELKKNTELEKAKKGANFTLEIINSVLGGLENPGAKPEEYNLMYPREIMGLITDQMMQAALKDTLITMSAMSGDENY